MKIRKMPERQAMKIRKMPNPTRMLLMLAWKTLGNAPRDEVIGFVEEHMTAAQRGEAEKFLDWLLKNGLTVGHGTIDLRYSEFKNRLSPMPPEDAYQWAMKRSGL